MGRIIYKHNYLHLGLVKWLREEIREADIKMSFVIAAVASALMLCLRQYYGSAIDWFNFLENGKPGEWKQIVFQWLFVDADRGLHSLLFWAGGCVFFYLLLPAFISGFVLKTKPSESGIVFKIPQKHWKIYGLLILIVMPFVVLASFSDHFQATYPFYRVPVNELDLNLFLIWEIAYFLQFVGIEYFFRGFLLFQAEKHIGRHAVLFAMLPYCMIHFGKPLPETLGAIVAGIVLGTMALRSRSIIPGIIVHYTVAISMDLLSLGMRS